MFIGALLGTVAYFFGLLVMTGVMTYIFKNPNEAPHDGDFSIISYFIGSLLFLGSTFQLFLKARELMEHFEKIGKTKIK